MERVTAEKAQELLKKIANEERKLSLLVEGKEPCIAVSYKGDYSHIVVNEEGSKQLISLTKKLIEEEKASYLKELEEL